MPDFQTSFSVLLRYPRPQVFEFFSLAENLNLLTPPRLRFSILTPLPIEMTLGKVIKYQIKLRGLPIKWESEITEWEPPLRFTGTQIRGPANAGVHRHLFEETPEGTLAADDVAYQAPGGAPVNRLFVAGELRKIFGCRQAKLLELYPNRCRQAKLLDLYPNR